ncbi:MAG: hypothetical protein GY884_24875 [Proteobacteria bacterium]|nr:hypothetical protein [Pseudomonadota bacterium]
MFTLLAAIAFAQDPALTAEYRRLHEEASKLAGKNRWEGVERLYVQMVELGIDVTFDDHMLGAQAARDRGDTVEMLVRLDKAAIVEPLPEATQLSAHVRTEWSWVVLTTEPLTPTILQQKGVMFAADERAAVEFAQAIVEETGEFTGWLPPSKYRFAGHPFEANGAEIEVNQNMSWGGKSLR